MTFIVKKGDDEKKDEEEDENWGEIWWEYNKDENEEKFCGNGRKRDLESGKVICRGVQKLDNPTQPS